MKVYSISDEYLEVKFTDLGGRILEINSIYSPYNLVLQYPAIYDANDVKHFDDDGYENDDMYIGAIAGRYANRISGAAFTLENKKYRLFDNDNGNCLHGGNEGYSSRYFDVECSHSTALLTLTDDSDMFPGSVDVKIKYSVIGSSLMIQYQAKTNSPTVINLTSHTYFAHNGSIDDCVAVFNADHYTPLGENMIPTGEIASVKGTPFDFTTPKTIGSEIYANSVQLNKAGGFDHNFVINGEGLRKAAAIYMPENGVTLTVSTTMPGFQFYTGNFLHEPFENREGFCLETQYYPDSPNKPNFPSCVFTPDKPFRGKTIFSFAPGNTTAEEEQ